MLRKLAVIAITVLCFSAALFALDRQPNQDYRARRVALSEKTNGGVVLLFASSTEEGESELSGFRQNPNFYYLTGWNEPGAALVISPAVPAAGGRPARKYEEMLFLPAHNVSQEKWTGPKLGAENPEVRSITGVDRVRVLDALRDELVRILPSPRATIYTDLAGAGEKSPATVPLEWLRRANTFPNYNSFADVKPLLTAMRMVKDAGEMERIRRATDASMAAHLAAFKAIRPGVSEREISALMQYEFGRRGCERPAYAPIVGAGFNGTVLHYAENSGTAKAGDLIVMDVAGEYGGYASDITRTAPASGRFSRRQRELYDIVLGAQQAAIDAFRTGKYVISPTAPNSLYRVAYDYINTHGTDTHGQPLGKYFLHGLSHHVGLEVHDASDNSALLERGMVFSLEPGIYIPEENLGIRIEDLAWIDPGGKLVLLTRDLPRTADEIEKAMGR